ncbi:MAG: family 43 glycosylhydrolase, partial [Clostridiaceae bacterium]|nr:family 43 glycosylhydrolase [Clostridiaceae bacterium]
MATKNNKGTGNKNNKSARVKLLQTILVFAAVLAIAAAAVAGGLHLQQKLNEKASQNGGTGQTEVLDGENGIVNKGIIDLTILEKASGYIMAYTKSGDDRTLDQSLHLAWSDDGRSFAALNADNGICFARRTDGDHTIENPFLFLLKNGDYGMISVSSSRPGKAAIYTSQDMVIFDQEIVLDLKIDKKPAQLQCFYDLDQDTYVILWSDGKKQFKQTTADFQTISKPEAAEYAPWSNPAAATWPEKAIPGNILAVDQATLDYVRAKLLPVQNISIDPLPASIAVDRGDQPTLPGTATANYSDGSSAQVPISWDSGALDINKAGTYKINGTIGYPQFDNPFIESKADPWITIGDDGKYYFTASYPMYSEDDEQGYSKVTLRRADDIAGLQNAEEVTIWTNNAEDKIFRYIWAPEIHQINGVWYMLFTGSRRPNDVFAIRPHILKCEPGSDPMDPTSWQSLGLVRPAAGDSISFQTFSLDMTYFEAGGEHYVVWAEKTTGDSLLFIATIDPDNPARLTSPATIMSMPEFAWEQVRYNVNEGAAAIKRDGKIYLCFSAAGTGPEYCIGIL